MKLYKPHEAAPLLLNAKTGQLGISAARVRELCRQRRLGQRVGRGWVITPKQIDAFNAQHRPDHRPKKS